MKFKQTSCFVCMCSPEPVWLRRISAGLCGFRPRKDNGVLAKPGGERPKRERRLVDREVSGQLRSGRSSTAQICMYKHSMSRGT